MTLELSHRGKGGGISIVSSCCKEQLYLFMYPTCGRGPSLKFQLFSLEVRLWYIGIILLVVPLWPHSHRKSAAID